MLTLFNGILYLVDFAMSLEQRYGDIDTDWAPDDREKVYKYIIDRFGEDKTAYIVAFGTITDKATIDEIGRALNISLEDVKQIKKDFEEDPIKTREKWQNLFYYFDGMLNTTVSQGIHPAGIVASPITLPDNYGVFHTKEGLIVLDIDMEEVHECGLVKYDILGLKNIGIIRDCCKIANIPYPQSNMINWNDQKVWEDMITSPVGIFQFEGSYAFDNLKKFAPKNINDMSLVNAALRPSGASYRDSLLAHEKHHNPSKLIDDLLEPNYGYLCIEENQNIRLIDSIKPIKEVQKGDIVYTTNGVHTVKNVFYNGEKPLVNIQTRYASLQCTPEHQILTSNGWKQCKDLTLNDYIAHYVDTNSNREIDKNILRLIGWLIGDGIIGNKNVVMFVNQNIDIVRDFKDTVLKLWGDQLAVNIHKRESRVNKIPLYYASVVWKNPRTKYN